MTRELFKAASYLALIIDNKILLSRRYNTTWSDGKYSLPSGHVESGETFTQALIREAFEEIDIIIEEKDLEVLHIMHRPLVYYVDVFFTTYKYKGEIKNKELDKCDDLKWFSLNNLPENIVPSVKYFIENYINGKKYSEFLINE